MSGEEIYTLFTKSLTPLGRWPLTKLEDDSIFIDRDPLVSRRMSYLYIIDIL